MNKIILISIIAILSVVTVSGCIGDDSNTTSNTSNDENIISVEGEVFKVPTGFKVNKDYDGFYNNENKQISIFTGDYAYDNPEQINVNGISVTKYENVTKLSQNNDNIDTNIYTVYAFEKGGKNFIIDIEQGIDNPDDVIKQILSN